LFGIAEAGGVEGGAVFDHGVEDGGQFVGGSGELLLRLAKRASGIVRSRPERKCGDLERWSSRQTIFPCGSQGLPLCDTKRV
jgi:hypothetical protein